MFGCGAAMCVHFFLLCAAHIGAVAAVKKEMNSCVCVSSCVWVEYCCLLHYHRLLPLPPHFFLLQLWPEGERRGGGIEGKKGTGRENE